MTKANALPSALILTLLFGTQPIAMDLYLPALPEIASHFGGKAERVQWTLTTYLLAFGISQLFIGQLADRYGRRLTLLWGLALYALAGLTTALAGNLLMLIGSRALLGVATAACVISVRAVIRDCYSGAAGLGIVAKSMTGMSAIALVSPVLGGFMTSYLGWHAALALIAVFGGLAWYLVYAGFAETGKMSAQTSSIPIATLLRHPQFIFSSLLSGSSFSGAVCFLLLSPFIFINEFGMSRIAYGLVPGICSAAFLSGTLFCRHYLLRVPIPMVVRSGTFLSVAGGAGHLLLWNTGMRDPWLMLVAQCLFMFGHGIHQPCGQGGAVSPFAAHAGRAAAVSGFLIIATAFVVGQVVSRSPLPASQTFAFAIALVASAVAIFGWFAIPRAYQPAVANECSHNS